jgi:DNA-binding GntR family transcriptional regulator
MEPHVAELAAERMGKEELRGLYELNETAKAMIDDQTRLPEFSTIGLEFHTRLAPGCGNPLLAGMLVQLTNAVEHPLWALVNQQAVRERSARAAQVAEHKAILDAIAAGDAARAKEEMRQHLGALKRTIFTEEPDE